MRTLAFVNKKGGAGKTTTAIGVALGLHRKGHRVGFVDADPNGSASRWLETIPEIDSVPCEASELAPLVNGLGEEYDFMLIDSAPNDIMAIGQLARVADHAYIPLAPTALEIDQLPDTVALIDETATPWTVIPVRVRLSTTSGRAIQDLCTQHDIAVTRAKVPLSEAIAKSMGEAPPPIAYSALVDEILAASQGVAV